MVSRGPNASSQGADLAASVPHREQLGTRPWEESRQPPQRISHRRTEAAKAAHSEHFKTQIFEIAYMPERLVALERIRIIGVLLEEFVRGRDDHPSTLFLQVLEEGLPLRLRDMLDDFQRESHIEGVRPERQGRCLCEVGSNEFGVDVQFAEGFEIRSERVKPDESLRISIDTTKDSPNSWPTSDVHCPTRVLRKEVNHGVEEPVGPGDVRMHGAITLAAGDRDRS
jgi:hypothetical protein